jgi:hypothetical protein
LYHYFIDGLLLLDRFLETIMSLREWQDLNMDQDECLEVQETRMDRYMSATFDHWLSTLPILFDRISAMAGPLYGFDVDQMWANKSLNTVDWNVCVDDFLRKQDRLGGPPTAVAIVLDAQSTHNIHMEQGFQLEPCSSEDITDLRVLWPAVYIRSTLHLTATSFRPGITKQTGSGILRMNSGGVNTSGSSLRPIRSVEKLTPRQRIMQPHKLRALEYGPESGTTTTFPHNEWNTLVSLLPHHMPGNNAVHTIPSPPENMEAVASVLGETNSDVSSEETLAVTYRDTEAKEMRESLGTVEEVVSLFHGTLDAGPDKTTSGNLTKSVFHVVPLSDYLSMVVIVKGEEESRWHRRRSRLPDEEIRSFLNDLSSKLRVSSVFSPHALPDMKDRPRSPIQLPDTSAWEEKDVQEFLKHLKEAFGLRPVSLLQDSFLSLGGRNSPNFRRSLSRSGHRRPVSRTMQDSAAVLFLGRELASLLMNE